MAVLKIAQMGSKILKNRAQEITNFDEVEINRLFEDMIETMEDSNGIGLAAPQVFFSIKGRYFFCSRIKK